MTLLHVLWMLQDYIQTYWMMICQDTEAKMGKCYWYQICTFVYFLFMVELEYNLNINHIYGGGTLMTYFSDGKMARRIK